MNGQFNVGDEVILDDSLYGTEYYGTVREVIPTNLPGFAPMYEVEIPGLMGTIAVGESYLKPYRLGIWTDEIKCECGADKAATPNNPAHHAHYCPKKGR